MTTLGADYSSRVNAVALRQAGLLFGSTRLTTEPGTIDPTAAPNIADLRSAGLTAGAYAFLVHHNAFGDAAAQARAFIDALGDPDGMLVQLDVERPNYPVPHPPATVADIRLWCATWTAAHPGHPVLLYLPRWWWSAAGYSGDLSGLGPLWASWYLDPVPQAPTIAAIYEQVPTTFWTAGYGGWKTATLLQFTGTQHIVAGTVDLNATEASLASLTGAAMPIYSLGGLRTGVVAAGTPYFTNPGDATPRAKTSATARYLLTATDATGTWYALDGGYAGPTGTKPQMCGWVKAADVSAIEPAVPSTALYHFEGTVTSAAPPVINVTKE